MRVTTAILAAVGCLSLLDGLYIKAKATLAQYLIEDAWVETLKSGRVQVTPWRWADTWPVGRIRHESQDLDLYVLAGASGTSLAFGPGHVDGTSLPGNPGSSVVAGHRDTHFSFLESVEKDDALMVQNSSGHWTQYRVDQTSIVDVTESTEFWVDPTSDSLHLVTCYPFDAASTGGPLRYVVSASAR